MKLLVKNGILPGRGACDILVEDGRIAKIEPNLEDADAQVVDAQGRYVLPRMVDLHCHLRDPGLEYQENPEKFRERYQGETRRLRWKQMCIRDRCCDPGAEGYRKAG